MHRKLSERLKESEDNLPLKYRHQPKLWVLDRTVPENFFHINRHLDYTYNNFLLERTLVKRLRTPTIDLINVSRSLLSTLLVMTGNRHRLGTYGSDLPWLVRKPMVECNQAHTFLDCSIRVTSIRRARLRATASFTQQISSVAH